MTANRNISDVGPRTGQDVLTEFANTSNALANYVGGNAISPIDTNAYKFTIDVMTGLSGIPDGFELDIIIPNTNTNAVTFEITGSGTGTKAVKKSDGTAFSGGELVAGTAYRFKFWGGSNDHWRAAGVVSQSAATTYLPLVHPESFTTAGAWSWTAPWDCDVLVIFWGAGGSGARTGNNDDNVSGAAGAGLGKKFISVLSGNTLSGVVGAPGAAVVTGSTDGNNGGNTTATSSDVTLNCTATGGQGGNYDASGDAAGALGGTSTGGDVNFTGGNSAIADGVGSNNGRTTGGGSTGIEKDGVASVLTIGGSNNVGPVAVPGLADKFDGTDGASISDSAAAEYGAGSGAANQGGESGAGGLGGVIILYSSDKAA